MGEVFPSPAVVPVLQRQHGLVTRGQLRALDVPAATADTWVARGVIEPVERGVYRAPGVPTSRVQRIMAAVLRCGSAARAGGWSACALHGLEGFSLSVQRWVVVPPSRRVRGVDMLLQRSTIASDDCSMTDGVPTVSARRALVDVAIRVRGKRLRVAIDDARRRDLLSLEELLSLAVELPKHPGAAQIRRMFGSGTLDQDGEIERVLAVALAERGIFPLWSAEVLPGIFPDAAMPEASLVVECDSRLHHSLRNDRADDAAREGLLRLDGWEVLRATGRELTRQPDALADRILRVHSERTAAGLRKPGTWRPLTPGRRLRP